MRFTSFASAAKGGSSGRWLQRQANDPYVRAARQEGYRARSAFKLLEMDARYGLLRPGMAVVECGAAPGSWTQVAAAKVNAGGAYNTKKPGVVVGCDLLHVEPVDGAVLLPGRDFTHPETQADIREKLGERLADLVMSDMAPNSSGCPQMDHDAVVNLVYSALRFGALNSRVGASFLCKVWTGARTERLIADLGHFYQNVVEVKPKSSRADSAELYLLATKFRGIEKK